MDGFFRGRADDPRRDDDADDAAEARAGGVDRRRRRGRDARGRFSRATAYNTLGLHRIHYAMARVGDARPEGGARVFIYQ